MGKYQAYSEYEGADAEWLGQVPSHWTVSRTKFGSRLNPPKSEIRALPGNTEVTFLPMEAIGDDGSLDTSRTKNLAEVMEGYSYAADGDVMVAKITPCFENGKGAIAHGLCNGIGFATTEVIVVRPDDRADSRFLYYLLSAEPFRSIAEGSMYGAGGQKRVADGFLANYPTGWPSALERIQIAAFLDHETAEIDRLIAKQERLIELLKEKRQAVISHAVTKGLNPDAPMKDSGVEWLGEVPAHWAISRLKHETTHIVDCLHSTPHYTEDGEHPAIRTADISPGKLDLIESRRVTREEYRQRIARLEPGPGDIVYSREGERFGMAALIPKGARLCLGQRVMMFRVESRTDSRFLMWALNATSTYRQAQQDVIGATSPHVNVETIRNFWLAHPPLGEQVEICNWIAKTIGKVDRLIGKAERSIALMLEHRTALISAAVTGKIDVRGWKQPMQEATQEASYTELPMVAEAAADYRG